MLTLASMLVTTIWGLADFQPTGMFSRVWAFRISLWNSFVNLQFAIPFNFVSDALTLLLATVVVRAIARSIDWRCWLWIPAFMVLASSLAIASTAAGSMLQIHVEQALHQFRRLYEEKPHAPLDALLWATVIQPCACRWATGGTDSLLRHNIFGKPCSVDAIRLFLPFEGTTEIPALAFMAVLLLALVAKFVVSLFMSLINRASATKTPLTLLGSVIGLLGLVARVAQEVLTVK